jgi:hypothetical protein
MALWQCSKSLRRQGLTSSPVYYTFTRKKEKISKKLIIIIKKKVSM